MLRSDKGHAVVKLNNQKNITNTQKKPKPKPDTNNDKNPLLKFVTEATIDPLAAANCLKSLDGCYTLAYRILAGNVSGLRL